MSVLFDMQFLAGSPTAERPAPPGTIPLTGLIAWAVAGDQRGWLGLMDRYESLVHNATRRYRLSDHESQDVSQIVWLRLVEHIGQIREPLALPGWLLTTTRNEALRVLKSNRRTRPVPTMENPMLRWGVQETTAEDDLLRDERRRAVREGLAELKPQHRELLLLLHADPAIPYQQISRRLGIPVGSIGPTRARCLEKLRKTKAICLLAAS